MNSYELVLILRTDVDDQERTAVLDRTKEIITGDGGVIVKIDEWGKRRLAYEIKDLFDGVYYILFFEATSKTLDEVTRVLGITDSVLRFMPLRHEKPFSFQQLAATSEAASAGSTASADSGVAPAAGADASPNAAAAAQTPVEA